MQLTDFFVQIFNFGPSLFLINLKVFNALILNLNSLHYGNFFLVFFNSGF